MLRVLGFRMKFLTILLLFFNYLKFEIQSVFAFYLVIVNIRYNIKKTFVCDYTNNCFQAANLEILKAIDKCQATIAFPVSIIRSDNKIEENYQILKENPIKNESIDESVKNS